MFLRLYKEALKPWSVCSVVDLAYDLTGTIRRQHNDVGKYSEMCTVNDAIVMMLWRLQHCNCHCFRVCRSLCHEMRIFEHFGLYSCPSSELEATHLINSDAEIAQPFIATYFIDADDYRAQAQPSL